MHTMLRYYCYYFCCCCCYGCCCNFISLNSNNNNKKYEQQLLIPTHRCSSISNLQNNLHHLHRTTFVPFRSVSLRWSDSCNFIKFELKILRVFGLSATFKNLFTATAYAVSWFLFFRLFAVLVCCRKFATWIIQILNKYIFCIYCHYINQYAFALYIKLWTVLKATELVVHLFKTLILFSYWSSINIVINHYQIFSLKSLMIWFCSIECKINVMKQSFLFEVFSFDFSFFLHWPYVMASDHSCACSYPHTACARWIKAILWLSWLHANIAALVLEYRGFIITIIVITTVLSRDGVDRSLAQYFINGFKRNTLQSKILRIF